jgi:ATP synthase protein I
MGKAREFRKYLHLSSIGIEMGVATMIGLAMGWGIDKYIFKEKYKPLFTLIFLFFGFAAGIKNLLLLIKRSSEKNGNNEQ